MYSSLDTFLQILNEIKGFPLKYKNHFDLCMHVYQHAKFETKCILYYSIHVKYCNLPQEPY